MATMSSNEQSSIDVLQGHVQALQAWMGREEIDGPYGVQVALLWAAMVLRDQADMSELGQACYETAQAATQLYQARAVAVAQQRGPGPQRS